MTMRSVVAVGTRLAWPAAFCGIALLAGLAILAPSNAADKPPAVNESKIVGWDEANARKTDWGEMRFYFTGETAGTKNVLTAAGVIEPGKAVHGAHRHAEEEYLAVVEGAGTWHLNGKDTPAKRGDVLFTAPWVYHGLKNTGDQPLIFLVVRYSGKGVAIPPRPDTRPDELK